MDRPLPDLVVHCCELMRGIGAIQARPMMGGYMLKCDDAPVGVIAWDTLYLKVDDQTKPRFIEAGGTPFRYEKDTGKVIEMSYITPPPEAMESEAEMAHWARLALVAGRKAAASKAKKAKR